ncbi:MAG: iron ABC transporter permease [Defluviitaleaceae bacterium]|nr:iron ABC transporter permease [Defluviitaleaceae bacterium]
MNKKKIIISIVAVLAVLCLALSIGSVFVHPLDILRIITHNIFGTETEGITRGQMAIIWSNRLPRVVLAFIAGAMLSLSGAIMQSVLRNPLASSFTLGVSSGASLGAAMVLFLGITLLPVFTIPLLGFGFAMGTMLLVMALATKLDKTFQNNTIILIGMMISLFINAIVTLLMILNHESLQSLIFWQLGSFSNRGWLQVSILGIVLVVGALATFIHHREMDVMTFGEGTAKTIGVNAKATKITLLIIATAMTGSAIAFVGIIGFVDLVTPHIVRRLFGSRHKHIILFSVLFGGMFMVVADTISRSIAPPTELPIGVITALVGGPFFGYLYFKRRKE